MSHREKSLKLISEERPLVVGVISEIQALETSLDKCDVIELRIDSLGSGPKIQAFAKNCPIPLLITARGPAEGGQSNWTFAQRTDAYRTLLPFASMIDIELRDLDEFTEVISEAHEAGVTVVGSFHDFKKTPELSELTSKLDKRADLHKFALMVNSPRDLTTHLSLIESLGEAPFSLMGMGPLGAAARPLMAKAGSRLNYGYLGSNPTAPNQWPVGLLSDTLSV